MANIENIEYMFQLMGLKDAMQVQSKVIRLISQSMGNGTADDNLFYEVGAKVLKHATADGYEITDIDDYFKTKPILFNKVVIAAIQENFPDLFTALKKKGSSEIINRLQEAGLT